MKNLYLLFIVFVAASVVSCGQSGESEPTPSEPTSVETPAETPASTTGNAPSTIDNEDFMIEFPGETSYSVDPMELATGNSDLHMYIYEESREKAYILAYNDYGEELVAELDPMQMLYDARNGTLQSLQIMDIITERENNIDGNAGLYTEATNNSDNAIYQFYIVNDRLYQLGILHQGGEVPPAEAEEFFSSFELK